MAEMLDGKPVKSTQSQQSTAQTGEMLDGKPIFSIRPPSTRYQIDPNGPDIPSEGGEGFFTDLTKGAMAGGLFSIYHGGDLVRHVMGLPRVIDQPEVQKAIAGPDTTYGQLGKGLEQMGEFFIPVPGTGKLKALGEGAGMVKRALAYGAKDALQNTVVTGIQTGGDPVATGGAAALGGGVGMLTGAGGAMWDRAAKMTQDVDPARVEAARFGRSKGITVDPATRTGSRGVANVKKGLESGINMGKAEDLTALQSKQYGAAGQGMLRDVSKGAPVGNRAHTGNMVYDSLSNVAEGHAQDADQAFGGFRSMEQMVSPQQLQYTTTEQVDTAVTNPLTGLPVKAPQPVTKQAYFRIPVDRSQLQADLRALSRKMGGTLDLTQQAQSPALQMMKDIIYGDSVVEASKALQDLSAMYEAFKLQPGQVSRDVSQFLGSGSMQKYRQVVDQSIASVNPTLLDLVDQGREAVKQQHQVQDLMRDVGGRVRPDGSNLKPVRVANNLLAEGDINLPMLQNVAARSPNLIPSVAATYMKNLLDIGSKSGAAKESFTHGAAVLAKWDRLGPESKQILFGPQVAKDLDNFFRLGKYLSENPNASGSGAQVLLAARLTQLLTHPSMLMKDLAVEHALGKYVFSDRGPLPYMRQISPGVFGVNPAAVGAGATWRLITGEDPASYHNELENMQPNASPVGSTRQ